MSAPKRPFEMILELGADSLEAIAQSLHSLSFAIYSMIESKPDLNRPYVSTSGSPSSGWNLSLIRTDTTDHDEYFKKLDEWLADRRAEKEAKETQEEPEA